MGRRFRGESVHKVDSKGRVSIPAAFRRVLEEGDPDWTSGANPNLVLVYGRKGRNCLEGYSLRSIEEVDDMVSTLPRFSQQREILERMLNSQSTYAQVDENGRMVLPAKLRKLIGVTSEATFAGMGDKFQIWAPDAYGADNAAIDTYMDAQDDTDAFFAVLQSPGQGG